MTKFKHRHDVISFGKSPEQNCADNSLGESARKIPELISDHGDRDTTSHIFRHAVVNDPRNASYNDFGIIESGFRNNAFTRKVTEAL